MEKKLFICNEIELRKKKFIIKFFEELKDELIIFFDKNYKKYSHGYYLQKFFCVKYKSNQCLQLHFVQNQNRLT